MDRAKQGRPRIAATKQLERIERQLKRRAAAVVATCPCANAKGNFIDVLMLETSGSRLVLDYQRPTQQHLRVRPQASATLDEPRETPEHGPWPTVAICAAAACPEAWLGSRAAML
jgi:hypothetical protein